MAVAFPDSRLDTLPVKDVWRPSQTASSIFPLSLLELRLTRVADAESVDASLVAVVIVVAGVVAHEVTVAVEVANEGVVVVAISTSVIRSRPSGRF